MFCLSSAACSEFKMTQVFQQQSCQQAHNTCVIFKVKSTGACHASPMAHAKFARTLSTQRASARCTLRAEGSPSGPSHSPDVIAIETCETVCQLCQADVSAAGPAAARQCQHSAPGVAGVRKCSWLPLGGVGCMQRELRSWPAGSGGAAIKKYTFRNVSQGEFRKFVVLQGGKCIYFGKFRKYGFASIRKFCNAQVRFCRIISQKQFQMFPKFARFVIPSFVRFARSRNFRKGMFGRSGFRKQWCTLV